MINKRVFNLGLQARKCIYFKSRNYFSQSNSSFQTQEIQNKFDLNKINISNTPYIYQDFDKQHFDVAIIGGGTAGLAFAFEAKKIGLKVVVFDYVDPSPRNTKWGLGGCCVNVGCIPKKLMHQAAIHHENIESAFDYGWDLDKINDYNSENNTLKQKFNWKTMVTNIQQYIKSTNYGYKSSLQQEGIPYINAMATLQDQNTVIFSSDKSSIAKYLSEKTYNASTMGMITANYIVIAVGGRPTYLKQFKNCEQYAITSDDIFSLKKSPEKTLVVGGGYVALECAGFLSGLGLDVTVMTRAIYLRSFDRQITQMILDDMEKINKAKIIHYSLPYEVQKNELNGKLHVKWQNADNQQFEDEFDTVLLATGRTAATSLLNLEQVGIHYDKNTLKIIGGFDNEQEKTSVQNIYALGDTLQGVPELQTIAYKSAQLLARRISYLVKKQNIDFKMMEKTKLNYKRVPTSVFTPLEYSCCGMNEEEANEAFGKENVQIYHSEYTPLEHGLSQKVDKEWQPLLRNAYCKIICNKLQNEKVVGLHYLGPNSGEIMQGFSVAMNLGLTKQDLEEAIGIHPTVAEEFVLARITKASGENHKKTSC